VRLEDLGYPESLLAALKRQLRMPRGVILFTGPAGSGKTTTIYAALKYILDETGGARNIVTVEDPVERVLPRVTQTQVHPATGLTFARCLRSLMRQDPEVIVIGEIRDRETAEIAVEAGLTGHLVISTVHSGTAAGVLMRLSNMKLEPHLLAGSVTFTVAQRLIRKLCAQCRERISDPRDLLGLSRGLLGAAYQQVGCDACFRTGYAGRTVIVECLASSRRIWDQIIEHAAGEALEAIAEEEGMVPLRQAALEAVKAGVTSPAEIQRVFGPE
jgi:type II secretory ATPase GspE/PulE/Tfp pilus assembly ATPase PilB-like protein